MALTDVKVRSVKPTDQARKLTDGEGMHLMVHPNGSKYWRLQYRFDGKQKTLALGVYPEISLSEARQRRDQAKRKIANGIDLSELKKFDKQTRKVAIESNFRALALEWHDYRRPGWSKDYADDLMEAFENDIFPDLGKRPIAEIKPLEMLMTLRKLEKRGVLDKLRKIRQASKQFFTYAIVTGRAEINPVADLASALATPNPNTSLICSLMSCQHFLKALENYSGSSITRLATRILMLTGVRTIELRLAEWRQFDLDKGIWEVPKGRMKMRRPHIVPLSTQVVEALREIQAVTGRYSLVLPGRNDASKPMSQASINQVLERIGYHGKATGHGFRHTMSTILHEQGYNTAWIELQLAHVDKNTIRDTYNHAQYLEQRREMLQWYGDYVDGIGKINSIEPHKVL